MNIEVVYDNDIPFIAYNFFMYANGRTNVTQRVENMTLLSLLITPAVFIIIDSMMVDTCVHFIVLRIIKPPRPKLLYKTPNNYRNTHTCLKLLP